MTKRLRASEPTARRIKLKEPAVRRIDPQAVATALGAEPCPERVEGRPGPVTLYALRSELMRRRQSSGGRPGIEGTALRAKIPLTQKDWRKLEALASSLSRAGFSPSAGQVASVLLSLALRSVTADSQAQGPTPGTLQPALAKELATVLSDES